MRVKRIGLEDHGNVTVFWGHIVHHTVIDADLPFTDFFQPGQQAQGGCLPAS